MIERAPEVTPEVTLRAALRDLRREAEALGASDAARWAGSLDERLRSRRLLVAVLGEHNRGKSTLINSLIGQNWLPVGQSAPALPPVYVYGGAREHVELVYDDGSTAESTRAELLNLGPDDAASVSYARVALPGPDLYGLVLVDTPGLNDPDTSRLTQTVYGLLPHSDLALLVLDSAQALGASEHDLVEQQILRAGLHRLVIVLNRDDELEDERQRDAVRDRVTRLLTPLLGAPPTILPLAARAALRARERNDTRLLSRSGYPELRALLQQEAAARMSTLRHMVVSRAQGVALDLRERAARPLPVPAPPRAITTVDPAQVEAARRDLDAARDDYALALREFTMGLRERLPEEIKEIPAHDIRRFLPFYIQQQFTTFLQEREAQARERLQTALHRTGVADLEIPSEIAGRALAPGLHPYVPPDFLEDSVLITTFMQVIGIALPSALVTALMTLGPMLRRFTRNIRAQDEHNALLQTAQAATMEAGAALERRIDRSFADLDDTLRLAAAPPAATEITVTVDDPARAEAVRRIDTMLRSLAQLEQATSSMRATKAE